MKIIQSLCLLLLGVLLGSMLLSPSQASSTPMKPPLTDAMRRDGNWWRTQSEATRVNYILGMIDGSDLGHQFTIYTIDATPRAVKCAGPASQSFNDHADKLLGNATVGQIKDGLNDFYGDFRNRRIKTYRATWVVINGIAGMSRAETEKAIEIERKIASK